MLYYCNIEEICEFNKSINYRFNLERHMVMIETQFGNLTNFDPIKDM